mgnify:CR=1 FL=1
MKLLLLTVTLLFSTYTFSGTSTASELVSVENGTQFFPFGPIIPKRPPINDDGPGGGGPR